MPLISLMRNQKAEKFYEFPSNTSAIWH